MATDMILASCTVAPLTPNAFNAKGVADSEPRNENRGYTSAKVTYTCGAIQ